MTNREKMIKSFKASFINELDYKEGYTYWQTLDIVNGKEFAIVLGWQDGFDTKDGFELCMKLAYLPTNSLMSEYGIDWIMPYDEETGEVDDTEMTVNCKDDIEEIVDWLLDVYNERYKEYSVAV